MPKTFVGARVRQLRGERGFSQAALAQMLEISPSYLNQIEHDVRPLTVAVLLRISEVFGVDATFFANQDDTRLVAELREVLLDRDLDAEVDPAEIAEVVTAHPALARAMNTVRHPYNVSQTILSLAQAVLERFADVQEAMVARTRAHRARLAEVLGRIDGATVLPSAGNMVLVRLAGDDDAPRLRAHLAERGVLVKDVSRLPGFGGA